MFKQDLRICIGGKNNIAVDVCKYLLQKYNRNVIYAIPNKNDNGQDGFQRSFKKFVNLENIKIVSLEDVYSWENLVFLSLEFDRIIKPERFRSNQLFNIHFSLLPKYKGCHTAAMPLLNGESMVGVTLHKIEAGIDTGDIIEQDEFEISDKDNCESLYSKLIEHGTELVKKSIKQLFSDSYTLTPQSVVDSTYYSRSAIDYSNIKIDLNATAFQIDRQIKAFAFRAFQLPIVYSAPIFFTVITNEKSKQRSGSILEDNEEFIKLSTIDYNICLFKDRLSDICLYSKNGDLFQLERISYIERYVNEKEPSHGWTPLMIAAYNNQYDIAKYLIEHGADVNAQNYNGTTVIMYAKDGTLKSKDSRLLFYLLSKGAKPKIKDYSGKNLYDYLQDPNLRQKIKDCMCD